MPYRNFLLDAVHEGLTWNIPNEVSADAVKAQAGLMADLLQTRRVHGERSRLIPAHLFFFPSFLRLFFQQYKLAPGSRGWPCTYGVGREQVDTWESSAFIRAALHFLYQHNQHAKEQI